MRLTTIPASLGPFITAFAPNVTLMAIGRLLSGVGAGASLVVVPIYISEIAPPESKGFYGSFTQIMINMGILIAQMIGYWLSHHSMWRVILAVAGIIGLYQAVRLLFAVESPKWLAEKGRHQESRQNLLRLRGQAHNIDEEIKSWHTSGTAAESERQGLLSQTDDSSSAPKTEDSDDPGFFQVLKNPYYRPAILAVIIVMASQQLTGINSIVMYGVSLLSSLLSSSSAILNIAVSALNVVATTAFAPLSDNPRLGRKGCLMLSISGMSISALLLGIGIRASVKILAAICVLTFVASFAIGLGPVPFMLASEMVDAKGVGATQSWALGANWIATFLVAQFFPILNEALGKGNTYFLFTVLGGVFLVATWRYVPETRGKNGMGEVWGYEERSRYED